MEDKLGVGHHTADVPSDVSERCSRPLQQCKRPVVVLFAKVRREFVLEVGHEPLPWQVFAKCRDAYRAFAQF